jgi:surfactin family lipopeptide synthetase C
MPTPETHLARVLTRAEAQPDAPAVSDPDGTLSYGALVERARATADDLVQHGLEPGDPVLLSLARSRFHLPAVVGVALAGGVYVPIDPADPDYRRRLIAEASGARFAITDVPDSDRQTLGTLHGSPEPPKGEETDDSLSYILFTSGSTGTPKGVEIQTAALDAFLAGCTEWAELTADDVVACFHAFTFDISVFEMWAPLAAGAEVFVVPRLAQVDARLLLSLLQEHDVSVLGQTPTALRQLAARVSDHGLPATLRSILVCGERLDFAWVRPIVDAADDERPTVWNLYGPTETTIYATGRTVTREDALSESRSLIGRALPHVSVEILDDEGFECEEGDVGEIVISGPGVARGYRGLRDPRFTMRHGARAFRSGDLGRYTQARNGREIEFVGRTGGFVKIRGYRLEPDEVAATLSLSEDVEDAAAVDVDFLPGGDAVAAAVILRSGATATDKDLREFLADRLPHYARPARIVQVEDLPRLSSGKLDRAALRAQIKRLCSATRPNAVSS